MSKIDSNQPSLQNESTQHLHECPGCPECDILLTFYTACDGCGLWMHNNAPGSHYYDLPTGKTYCDLCYEKHVLNTVCV